MCGRFTLTRSAAEVAEHFGLARHAELPPRYNIAPGQQVAVVRTRAGSRHLERRRWGLVPAWAKHAGSGARLINARVENARTRRAFREAWLRRRCLVPADGFYEWRRAAGRRLPHHVSLPDGALFGIAGLWEHWEPPRGEAVDTVTLLTCAANAGLRALHERMPLILPRDHYEAWLACEESDPMQVVRIGAALAAGLRFRPVNPRVNHVAVDDPDCLRAPPPERQRGLF